VISRNHLYAILLLAALVWGTLLFASGVSVSPAWLKPVTMVAGVLTAAVAIFDRWLWHLPLLHPWFVALPDIRGTWKGEIVATWVDPETDKARPPIEAYLVIRQTYATISMRMITNQSSSELLAASIVRDIDGNYRVVGTYRNTPGIMYRPTSPIHFGSLLLEVIGLPPRRLQGHYWTDRSTVGELNFDLRSKHTAQDFQDAQALFQSAS